MRKLLKSVLDYPVLKTNKKQIIFCSDDWGSVRIKSKDAQRSLVKKGLTINNRFDQYDSLETNEDLELLLEVLTKHNDHNGNQPVMTAVTNVGNPDFQKIAASNFNAYACESIDQTYQRYPNSDRVLSLMRQGIDQKIFIPQSHGREHVQVNWWMLELQSKHSYAQKYFDCEFYFLTPNQLEVTRRNRDLAAAFDVWDQVDLDTHKETLQSGLKLFKKLFGYSSKVFTPPAMFYSPALETMMYQRDIRWLDVGRFFKTPKVGGGERYQLNFLGRKKKSGLRVLVRNAVFEPNMSRKTDGVDSCLAQIERAFKAKQPAIISNHRAAFVGRLDQANRTKGLKALDKLIKEVLKKWPDAEFISSADFLRKEKSEG